MELALSNELPSAAVAVCDAADGAALEGNSGGLDQELVVADVPVPVVPVPVDVLAVM